MSENIQNRISTLLSVNQSIIVDHGKKDSLIHCILYCGSRSYNLEYIDNKNVRHSQITRKVRKELIVGFTKQKYESLIDGNISKYQSYKKCRSSLESNKIIEFGVQEYISDVFDIDIYIIYDDGNKLVVDIGDEHHQFYHKGRKSIIVYYDNGKFLSIGIEKNSCYYFLFEPTSKIIFQLYGYSEESD